MAQKINHSTATVIILDIGRNNTKFENESEKSFFKCARECTVRIIERKILSQENNYLGIVFIGSKGKLVAQPLKSIGCIEVFSGLQTPTWHMIRNLPKEVADVEGYWYESLPVAADLLKNGVSEVTFSRKKIILITNFTPSLDFDSTNVERLINRFKEEKIEIDILSDFQRISRTQEPELAQQIVQKTGGNLVSFEECMKFLTFYHIKTKTSVPTFQDDLIFSSKIKIPISCYIKLKDEASHIKWKKKSKDGKAIVKKKVYINSEKNAIVNENEVVKGYEYGQQIIPFPDNLKRMLYQSGWESLKVYGFTDANNVDWQHLNSNQMFYVCGRKGDKKAQQAIRCLVECLIEQNLVGIARRVFNKNDAPKMFALMPVVDTNNFACLSTIGLCYKEQIKYMTFPPTNLKKYQCTDDQVDAFKDLIKAMDLTKAYDENEVNDTETYPIAEMVNPTTQYILDCIAYRAMNPGKPLLPPREDIMMLFKVPPVIEQISKESIGKLKKIFVLKEVGEKTKTSKSDVNDDSMDGLPDKHDVEMDDVPKVDITSFSKTNKINKIGTVDAIHDYETLKRDGKTLNELSSQMTDVIESLIYSNLDDTYSKALECISFFRLECVNSDPSYYNNWIKDFKLELLDHKKNDILDLIISMKLDFILKIENDSSTFESSEQGGSQLYANDTATLIDVTISSDVKDFFEDL